MKKNNNVKIPSYNPCIFSNDLFVWKKYHIFHIENPKAMKYSAYKLRDFLKFKIRIGGK